MANKNPDWTKTGTIAGYAEYLRKQAGALCVVVIRRDDSALAVEGLALAAADPALPAQDLQTLIELHLPGLIEDVARARAEKRKTARLTWGDLKE